MRRVARPPLPGRAQAYLDRRQARLNALSPAQQRSAVAAEWKLARQTKSIGGAEHSVVSTLRAMAGARERCMYCLDSQACDIEHFRPKVAYPARAFVWDNLLLCCTHCGRLKGDRFPLANGQPRLVDPSAEDPWQFLDFEPDTGNLVPRPLDGSGNLSPKGEATVALLQLDRREPLSNGYRRTFRRLVREVQGLLDSAPDPLSPDAVIDRLDGDDDHGLLPWCFHGAGRTISPFMELREMHPTLWAACAAHFR